MTHYECERAAKKLLGPRAVCYEVRRAPGQFECTIGVRGPGCGVTLMRGAVFAKARGATWAEAFAALQKKVDDGGEL